MSRIRSLFAVCMLIAIGAMMPLAQAQVATAKAIIAGSSAIWQSAALGAYNSNGVNPGKCISGFTSPCFHYTAKNFQVNDTRPTLKGGTTQVDKNSIWIVWDSHTTTAGASPNFIAYIKVDSVVGDRCYYGQPRCNVSVVGGFPAAGNLISVWPDHSTDTLPPANVQAKFTAAAGILVSAAATDIRAEDGEFAMCRANSALSVAGGDASMKGLGYNSNNAAGTCATVNDLAHLTGGDISDVLGATAHILDFNVSGTDPFSGKAIVAGTTVPAGAAPIIPIAHVGVNGALNNVTDVSDAQLQALFANSGSGCKGTTLGGGAGNIDVFIREPLSGTYNTTEYNVFVYPDFSGTSQEAFLDPTVAGNNPLSATCPAGGGKRIRGVGTGNVIDNGTVKDTTFDSVAYTFAGWGNWKQASDLGSCTTGTCRYLTLNGVDGIFHKYVSTAGGTALDPGQPNTTVGQVPATDNLPAACAGNFPCREDQIWLGGLSYPNLRSGQYRAWSILRLISDGAALATVKSMVTASQAYSAVNTPDFVPIVAVAANAGTGFKGDPGLQLLRSHYQQVDNAGALIGPTPVNDSTTGDKGGDVGGCIEHFLPGTTANQVAESDSVTGLIHSAPGVECSFAPTSH
jgi:hypothetical protein